MIVTFRAELQSTWVGQPNVTMLPLSRLGRRDSSGIIGGVARGLAMPQAVVEQVRTLWPTRSTSRLASPSRSLANNRALAPGRPSGVSAGSSSRSMPASHLQPITDVAKPVSERAA